MPNFISVAQTGEVPPGAGKVVSVNGTLVALFNVDGSYYALNNTCLHRGGPLGEGFLEQDIVTCPWHGWRYNVKTGCNIVNQQIQVKTYSVAVEGEQIKVSLEP